MTMKRLSKTLLVLLCGLIVLNVNAKTVKVKGVLGTNEKDGEQIYLFDMLGTESQKMDSCTIKKGAYSFKGEFPRGFYRIGFNPKNVLLLILGSESMEIASEKGNLNKSKVTGSTEWELFKRFDDFNQNYSTEIQVLQVKANKARGFQSRNNLEMAQKLSNEVKTEYDSLIGERVNVYQSIIDGNPKSFVAKIAKFYLKVDNLKQEDFFTLPEVSDPEMHRGDMVVGLVGTYVQKFMSQQRVQSVENALKIIEGQPEGSNAREVLFIGFVRNIGVADAKSASRLGKKYAAQYPKSYYQINLVKTLPPTPLEIGDLAPEIIEENVDGEKVRLSSTRGKVVLLDFWASWCGPCRRENPNVVKAYHKYKDKGFTVFSVSLDKTANRWKQAIEKDKLVWPYHVSDLKGWSARPAKRYGVSSIPQTFLLDKDGKIIARNLRGAQLERKLAELLD